MKQGVLLLAHGAPERLADIPAYLQNVRGGRPAAPRVVEEVTQRYAEIGGSSPLLMWTRRQAEALGRLLRVPVYFGMRNWHPFIREAMARVEADGIDRLVALALAPQYSQMSVGLYIRRTEEARRETGARAELVWTTSFHDHPLLIEAFVERLRPLADARGSEPASEPRPSGSSRKVLFTAHSLPEKILENGDPYDAEARATARAVAERLGLEDWDFAYQSQGMTEEKWLGPTVESCLDRYAAAGLREVVVHPVGFVCDHVEILYDVDILFHRYAAERGMRLLRPETLNDSPKFIAALADIASKCLL